HAAGGKRDRQLEHTIGDKGWMRVCEELQILAHDEGMKQLFVNHVVADDRTIFPGIVDEELQRRWVRRLRRLRHDAEIEMEFDRIGNAGDEIHAAAPAGAWIV